MANKKGQHCSLFYANPQPKTPLNFPDIDKNLLKNKGKRDKHKGNDYTISIIFSHIIILSEEIFDLNGKTGNLCRNMANNKRYLEAWRIVIKNFLWKSKTRKMKTLEKLLTKIQYNDNICIASLLVWLNGRAADL